MSFIFVWQKNERKNNEVKFDLFSELSFSPDIEKKELNPEIGCKLQLGMFSANLKTNPTQLSKNNIGLSYEHNKYLEVGGELENLKNYVLFTYLIDKIINARIKCTEKETVTNVSINLLKLINYAIKTGALEDIIFTFENNSSKNGIFYLNTIKTKVNISLGNIKINLCFSVDLNKENNKIYPKYSFKIKFSSFISVTINLMKLIKMIKEFNSENFEIEEMIYEIISNISLKVDAKKHLRKAISSSSTNETRQVKRSYYSAGGI